MSVVERSAGEDSQTVNEGGRKKITVALRDARKSYGKGDKKNWVLDRLNLTVYEGTIYGLLGASGCGKSTVLSCIVGRKRITEGAISVFDGIPGDRSIGIPGNRVGYMPQELALYNEFTVRETLEYFGRLYEMKSELIKERIDFLLNLLRISQEKCRIIKLSGGQQRRVSFASALLHDPDLLILDEPTVGVDPKLRQNIWSHLVHLATSSNKTILITTHYIEEARHATHIGLMRRGRLLAESSPSSLLSVFQSSTLEDVFLKLCITQDEKRPPERLSFEVRSSNLINKIYEGVLRIFGKKRPPPFETNVNSKTISETNSPPEVLTISYDRDEAIVSSTEPSTVDPKTYNNFAQEKRGKKSDKNYGNHRIISLKKLWALMMKNFIRMWRNISSLIFIFLLPAVEVFLFCAAIGNDPRDLNFGIVNGEFPYDSASTNYTCPIVEGCEFDNLSCRYIDSLKNQSLLRFRHYENDGEARDGVLKGEVWGFISLSQNFSEKFMDRMWDALSANEDTIFLSSLRTHLDMTNQQVAFTLKTSIYNSYQNFVANLLGDCDLSPEISDSPIRYEKPIYGEENPNFTSFMAPGIIIFIIYFLAMALTGDAFLIERRDGLLDRSWVAGVSPGEYIAAGILTQFVVMIIQTTITLFCILVIFGIACNGPLAWLIILTLLQGTAGMAFGFLNSSIFTDQSTAIQVAIACFYPNLLLSGIIWPLEAMPYYLKSFAYYLPSTAACQAMRDIMARGWDVSYASVYSGVIISSVWISLFIVASFVTIKLTV